ncbi:MAG: DUF2993 domain-containing protein [Selenomonadaceae bacterium]|nr:DUF2993 domain-containing protein [Selenomonadaceae bacterium]
MKSKVSFFAILLVAIVLAFGEVVAPALAESTVAHRITEKTGSQDVTVQFSSTPRFLMLLGQVDHVHAVAHQGRLGEVLVSELALDGSDVRLDMPELVNGEDIQIKSAGELKLTGVVTEDNLKELLARKADKLENAEVTIAPDGVTVKANVKIFGRMADAELTGTVVDDGGQLMFHMTSLTISNAPFGKASLGSLFGDIPLVKRGKMPLGLRVTDTKMQAGKVVITAEYDANAQNADVLAPYYE